MKAALAPPDDDVDARVEPATAAHPRASVVAVRRPVAGTTVRSRRPDVRIRVAVVGRAAQVDELARRRLARRRRHRRTFELEEERLHGAPTEDRLDLLGATVDVGEAVADEPEMGKRRPAGLHRTRAGHAVTLAAERRAVGHRLQRANTPRDASKSDVMFNETATETKQKYKFIYLFIIGFYIPPTCANTSARSAGSRVWYLGPFSGFLLRLRSSICYRTPSLQPKYRTTGVHYTSLHDHSL